jgi:tetratricopeptide (TPR) repeat protein
VRSAGDDITGSLVDRDKAIALMADLCQRLGPDWPPEWANALARAIQNRGVARRAGGNLAGALADYDTAIALMEDLRNIPQMEWPLAWADNLAGVYKNRGNLRRAVSDFAGARADYDTAIALMEDLRRSVGVVGWHPAWANNLAAAYANRGNARADGGDPAGARADYDIAMALMENLRQQMGENWPLP